MSELLKKWLLTSAAFDGPNDQGKPEIKVDSVDNRNRKDGNLDPAAKEDDEENEDEEEEEQNEKENKENNENETPEQKAERIAKEKEERRQTRVQKRIDKLTAQNATAQNEIAELKKQLAEKPVEGLTEEEVERRAAKKAEDIATAKEADRIQKEFEKIADTLIKGATKIDDNFETKINEVAKETGVLMPKYMVEILADLDHKNGAEILAHLATDEDLYEEICVLSERRMTKRLDKMSEEFKNKNKIKPPAKERVIPDPIEPINDGSSNRGNNLPKKPTENMDEYVRVRNLQTEQIRKQGKNIW